MFYTWSGVFRAYYISFKAALNVAMNSYFMAKLDHYNKRDKLIFTWDQA